MSGPKTAHVVKLNKRKEDVNCFSEQKSRETDANPGRYLKENFVPSEFDFGFKRSKTINTWTPLLDKFDGLGFKTFKDLIEYSKYMTPKTDGSF